MFIERVIAMCIARVRVTAIVMVCTELEIFVCGVRVIVMCTTRFLVMRVVRVKQWICSSSRSTWQCRVLEINEGIVFESFAAYSVFKSRTLKNSLTDDASHKKK
jgi:hypothetical protein